MADAGPMVSISERIGDVDRQILRKMKMLQKQVGFTELFDDSSRLEAEHLETTLAEKISEVDSLITDLNESIQALQHIADRDQSLLLAQLKKEFAYLDIIDDKVSTLLKIADFLEVVDSCNDDPTTALEYLKNIESLCTILDQWSGGNLLIVKNISQYVLNKRYTLEAEHRKTLLKIKDNNIDLDPFSGDVDENFESEDNFLAKLRDTLRTPLEPTEKLSSSDFGGPGDVKPCQVSLWLRPLVVEILETSNQTDAVELYMAFYKQMSPSLSLRECAIFLCNSMYFSHKILLYCLVHDSRIALSAAVTLRRFAMQLFMVRVKAIKFESSFEVFDEVAFAEYPQVLGQYCRDLKEILPQNVYEKLLVLLSDHFLRSLVHVVMNTGDIESDLADRWAHLLLNIVEKMNEIVKGVELKSLLRAAELKNTLTYGLKDFAAQWKNPQSELRAHFQANEVRHLIRAIFQNSEMKCSILAHIQ